MTPVDVLKRELDTTRAAVKNETQIRDDHLFRAGAYDERLARHSQTIEALLLAIATLEPK